TPASALTAANPSRVAGGRSRGAGRRPVAAKGVRPRPQPAGAGGGPRGGGAPAGALEIPPRARPRVGSVGLGPSTPGPLRLRHRRAGRRGLSAVPPDRRSPHDRPPVAPATVAGRPLPLPPPPGRRRIG